MQEILCVLQSSMLTAARNSLADYFVSTPIQCVRLWSLYNTFVSDSYKIPTFP